jgi:hypothetical protein
MSQWQVQTAGGERFRYLPDPNDEKKIFVDWDGKGTILTVTKQSQDRYATRTPADEKYPDGELIRSGPWWNFSELLVAERKAWFARARRKEARARRDQAQAEEDHAQAEEDEANDQALTVAKSVHQESVEKSKLLLLRPALTRRLWEFYRQRGENVRLRSVDVDATIVDRLRWLLENPTNGRTLADGHRYIFNTVRQWHDDHFRTWSERTLKRAFGRLKKHQVIFSKQPEGRRSRRKWYRLAPEWVIMAPSGLKPVPSGHGGQFRKGPSRPVPSGHDDHFPSSETTAENTSEKTAVAVVESTLPPAAKAATADELIKSLQKRFPQHNVPEEYANCKDWYRTRGRRVTESRFTRWMERAELPLEFPKRLNKRPNPIPPPAPKEISQSDKAMRNLSPDKSLTELVLESISKNKSELSA